jgi:hypothetical protein
MYQSGAATTASRLGMPDLAIATLNDFVQSAQMVCSLSPSTPVIADADTGQVHLIYADISANTFAQLSFGGTAMVARTVYQYIRAGVAGMHIEDQVQTKRCGHLMGKQVVSREEFVTRIRAAVIARDSFPGGSNFVRGASRCLISHLIYLNRSLLDVLIQLKSLAWKKPFFGCSWQLMPVPMFASSKALKLRSFYALRSKP